MTAEAALGFVIAAILGFVWGWWGDQCRRREATGQIDDHAMLLRKILSHLDPEDPDGDDQFLRAIRRHDHS